MQSTFKYLFGLVSPPQNLGRGRLGKEEATGSLKPQLQVYFVATVYGVDYVGVSQV